MSKRLIKAIRDGKIKKIKKYIEENDDVNYENGKPLEEAILKRDLDIITFLIEGGAKVYCNNLDYASGKGFLDVIRILSNYISIKDFGQSTLGFAINNNHLDVVEYLIQIIQKYKQPVLNHHFKFVSSLGLVEMVGLLIKYGADVHVDDDFPIRNAAINGRVEIVNYLDKHGADIHAMNDYALRYASNNSHFDVVRFIISTAKNDLEFYKYVNIAIIWASEEYKEKLISYIKMEERHKDITKEKYFLYK